MCRPLNQAFANSTPQALNLVKDSLAQLEGGSTKLQLLVTEREREASDFQRDLTSTQAQAAAVGKVYKQLQESCRG